MRVVTLCLSAATCLELLAGFQPTRRDDAALPLLRADNCASAPAPDVSLIGDEVCLIGDEAAVRVEGMSRMGERAMERVVGRL